MKKIWILLLTILACLTFTAMPETLTAAPDKPHILITNHSCYGGCHATDGEYESFSILARNAGFTIQSALLQGITDEDLEGVDILILATPPFALDDEDKAALRRFLRRGGGLMVLTYIHDIFDGFANLDAFLADYGIRYGANSPFNRIIANVVAGSPLSGPEPCESIENPYCVKYLNINTAFAQAAAITPNGYIMAAISNHSNLGSGRLVVHTADHMFCNKFIGRRDNEAFALNILNYLSGGPDLHVTLCKFKGRNIRPGSIVKLIAKVRNDGLEASEETIVRFFLCTTNTYDGAPPEVVATLGSVDLPARNPGKSKKVKVKVSIPDSVAPGDYYVIAVADPDGETSDSNISNNWKASKKKITIN